MKKRKSLLFAFLILGGAISTNQVWALEQVDDVYQIGTAQDLIDFASEINNGTITNTSNAVLTTDINMSGKGYTPIGNDSHKYGGTFDGQGHVIDYLVLNNGSYDNQGIFGVVTGGATIKNLIAGPNNSITGKGNVGGLIGIYNGNDSQWLTIENCGNEGSVTATGTGGAAIIGICYNGARQTKIHNCYNTGSITAAREAAILTGWFGGSGSSAEVKNFYNTGDVSGQDGTKYFFRGGDGTLTFDNVYDNHSTKYTQADKTVKSCASAWYRWPYDLNFSGDLKTTVWKFVASVNHPRPVAETSVSKDGDYYLMADQHDLYWLAMVVNNEHPDYKAKQTADVDFSVYTSKPGDGDDALVKNVMIGNADSEGKRYTGHFNGQGYTVTVAYDRTEKFAALFGMLGNGAIVENLRTAGTIKTSNQHAAGIAGGARGNAQIRNCISAVAITGTGGGDGTHAGICGFMFDTGRITNCAFVGSLTATDCTGNAGLLGYANGGDDIVLTNCYVYADFSFKSEKSESWAMKRNTNSLINCYYVEKTTSGHFQIVSNMNQLANKDSYTDQTVVGNGDLCFNLNNNTDVWHQNLGSDNFPLPFSNGHKVIYNHSSVYTNLQYKEGDYYQIANAEDLVSFAGAVNVGYTNINGKLSADIDFDGVNDFPGIGSVSNVYRGTLDGQLHKIQNLTMDYDFEGVGLVKRATAGTIIENLIIASSCSFKGSKAVAAFVGGVYENSGTVTFLNCGNEGTVISTGQNAGGILGCNFNGNANIRMINCYNTGTINSGSEGGALSGWVGENKQIYNCYNSGSLTNCAGLLRGNSKGNITNCWSTSDVILDDNSRIADNTCTSEYISDGTVFAALFNYTNADPVVDGSVWRMGADHPLLYGDAIAMREDCQNRMVTGTYDVTLYRTTVANTWNTFCVPFDMNASQIATVFGTGVKLTELDTESSDSETLHFKTAYTITAGKAYLVKPATAITSGNYATVSGVTVSADDPTVSENSAAGFSFKGVYSPTMLTTSDHVLTARNTIKTATDATVMNGFRAYLHETSAGARATHFVIDDEEGGQTTGIITPEGEVIIDEPVYNLNGQRVNQTAHGLMIKGGKKYVKM